MTPKWSDYASHDVPRWLLERASKPTPALTWVPFDGPEETWTYAELIESVLARSAGLQRRGITRGDAVGLVMDNSPDMIITWLAVIASGAHAVTINTRSSHAEIAWIAEHSRVRGLICSDPNTAELSATVSDGVWVMRQEELGGLDTEAMHWERPALDPRALASVLYTSGTTARPKGVRWTHANCLWAASVNAAHQGLSSDDRYLITLPLFHTNALAYQLLACLEVGAHIIVQPRFSASRFWDVSLRHQCTWTGVVHFIVRALRQQTVPAKHSYRGWAGSGVVHSTDSPAGVPITGWFGMTETISHPLYSPFDSLSEIPGGSVGVPAPEYDVAVDSESCELLVRGARGISLFDGYLHDEESTQAVLSSEGWFRTGDIVRRDDTGNYFFVERMGDVFKVGGENVSAAEIERCLVETDGIKEVCVISRSEPMLGSVPVAFVIADGDVHAAEERLRRAARRGLADFKHPRDYYFVDELPRSTLNKVAKGELRQLLAEVSR